MKIEDVKEGSHFLTLNLENYRDIDHNVQVVPNQTTIIDDKLLAYIGTLSIRTEPPGAEVFLDDHDFMGKTPAYRGNLIVGWHRIILTKKGYEDYKDEFRLKYGQEKKIRIKLKPKPGNLIVSSDPGGAKVILNGKILGLTPLDKKLPSGEHLLRVAKDGYEEQERSVIVEADKDTVVGFRLHFTQNVEVSGMIIIQAGEFIMGSEEGEESERPARKVWVEAFFIDKYEVTNRQYREFILTTSHRPPAFLYQERLGRDNQAVVGVSWLDAMAYAKWAGKRLPTEAEWEKSARGLDGRKYPWGAVWDKEKANSSESKITGPAFVGSFLGGISPFGLFDMAGNVLEWTADWFVSNYYSFAPYKNPKGARFGTTRVVRGGSWVEGSRMLRTSARKGILPTLRASNIGFRCAMDVK